MRVKDADKNVIHPRDTETSYLKVLVLCVPGAQSYEQLKTRNNTLHSIFHRAAWREA